MEFLTNEFYFKSYYNKLFGFFGYFDGGNGCFRFNAETGPRQNNYL